MYHCIEGRLVGQQCSCVLLLFERFNFLKLLSFQYVSKLKLFNVCELSKGQTCNDDIITKNRQRLCIVCIQFNENDDDDKKGGALHD